MSEVFASNEAVIELLDPITGSTLYTVQYTRDLSLSERPVYVDRSFARSGAVTSHRLRSKGSVTLRKDAESLDLVRELKRWQQGVTYYALTSDLKGKAYRHPNLRITMTNADGTVERQVAYGVRLSDRTLSRPDGGVVGDSISLDVLRGFDLSATEAADSEKPVRALDFARTGSATYINAAGTLSTATDGQARIGVPYGNYSASKAGLVLEGAGMNLLQYSSEFESVSWAKNSCSVTPNSVVAPDGTMTAATVTSSAVPGFLSQDTFISSLNGRTFTASVWLKATSTTTANFGCSDLTSQGINQNVTVTTSWQRFVVTGTFSSATASLKFTITPVQGGTGTIHVWRAQLEELPFATSYITSTGGILGTRSADLCGIVSPHNLLRYSEQFDNAVWGRGGGTGPVSANTQAAPDGTATADSIPLSFGSLTQSVSSAGAKTLTFAIWLKAASNVTMDILIGDGSSTTLASAAVTTSWQRFIVTKTTASSTTSVSVGLNLGGVATVYAWGAQLVEGSHPGIYVRTSDTAIPAPTSPALDPAWQQNGQLEFNAVVPANASVYIVGAKNPFIPFGLSTDPTVAYLDRGHNASSGTGGTAGRGLISASFTFDGNKHSYKIVWRNYTFNGVRYMPMELWIDGSLVASQDVATLYGATAWATIDPSKLISDGNVFAALSGLKLGYPSLPAGAIPA